MNRKREKSLNGFSKYCKTPEEVISGVKNHISKTDKFAFLCGFFMCLIINLFVYTNTCFVHDSIRIFDSSTGLNNGRLLVGPLMLLTNRVQLPWVIGLISCVIMGFITVYFSKIFYIKKRLNIILLAGLIITSDTIVVSHAYFGSLYLFLLSLLLVAMAVYYSDIKKYGYIISVVLMCLSLFIYQGFLATAIGLFIFKLIHYLLDNNNSKLKDNFIHIVRYASIVIISSVLYYVIWQVVLKLAKQGIVDYYAYRVFNDPTSSSGIFQRISESLMLSVFQLLGVASGFYALCVPIIILVALALCLLIIKKKSRSKQLLMALYIVTYIFSINAVYIISGTVTYALTVFSVTLPLLVVLYFSENYEMKKLPSQRMLFAWLVPVLCVVLIFGQTVNANSLYLKMKLNYDNAWSYSTRLMDRLEQTEGFDENTEIVIIAKGYTVTEYNQNQDILKRASYPFKSNIEVSYLLSNNSITYGETLEWFLTQEMDMDLNIEMNPPEYDNNEEIEKMGFFPKTDSVKWIDGKLVVKISERELITNK